MRDELTGLVDRAGEAGAQDNGVQATLEVGDEVLVGPARVARGVAGASGIVVDVADGWRWPAHVDDHVGEITLWSGDTGPTAIGWWTPLSHEPVTLVMDVAGMTLWNAHHELTTEDPTRIRGLLAAARTPAAIQ